MLNKYPLWKNLVILVALVIGFIYALPNLFPDDYAIQITGARSSTAVNAGVLEVVVLEFAVISELFDEHLFEIF